MNLPKRVPRKLCQRVTHYIARYLTPPPHCVVLCGRQSQGACWTNSFFFCGRAYESELGREKRRFVRRSVLTRHIDLFLGGGGGDKKADMSKYMASAYNAS